MNSRALSHLSDRLLISTPMFAAEKYDFRVVSVKIDEILKDKTRNNNEKIQSMFQLSDACSHEVNTSILCKIVTKSLDLINISSNCKVQDFPIAITLSRIASSLKFFNENNVGDREYAGLFLKLSVSRIAHEGFIQAFSKYLDKKVSIFDPMSLASSLKAVTYFLQDQDALGLSESIKKTLTQIKSKLITELEKRNPKKYSFQPCIIILKTAVDDPEIRELSFLKKIQRKAIESCPETHLLDLLEPLVALEPQNKKELFTLFAEKLNNSLITFSTKNFAVNQSFLARLFNKDSDQQSHDDLGFLLRNINLTNASWSIKLSFAVACRDNDVHTWFANVVRDDFLSIHPADFNKELNTSELFFVSRLFLDNYRTKGVKDCLSSLVNNCNGTFNYTDRSKENIETAIDLLQACAHNNFYQHFWLNKINDFFVNVFDSLDISNLNTILWANTALNFGCKPLLELIDKRLPFEFNKNKTTSIFITNLIRCSILHNEKKLPALLEKIDAKYELKELLSSNIIANLHLRYAKLLCRLIEPKEANLFLDDKYIDRSNLNEFEEDVEKVLKIIKRLKPKFEYQSQVSIAGILVDFVINHEGKKYILECDGLSTHYLTNAQLRGNDLIQDKVFKKLGYEVVHISNIEYYSENGGAKVLDQKLKLDIYRNPTNRNIKRDN